MSSNLMRRYIDILDEAIRAGFTTPAAAPGGVGGFDRPTTPAERDALAKGIKDTRTHNRAMMKTIKDPRYKDRPRIQPGLKVKVYTKNAQGAPSGLKLKPEEMGAIVANDGDRIRVALDDWNNVIATFPTKDIVDDEQKQWAPFQRGAKSAQTYSHHVDVNTPAGMGEIPGATSKTVMPGKGPIGTVDTNDPNWIAQTQSGANKSTSAWDGKDIFRRPAWAPQKPPPLAGLPMEQLGGRRIKSKQ